MLRSCDILTEDMLKAALRGQLPAERRAALLRHLGEPCEACLDLLEHWTTEEMLSELHASDDLLSCGEQERLFAGATGSGPSEPPALRLVRPERRRWSFPVWSLPVAAAVLLTMVGVGRLSHRTADEVGKGLSGPAGTAFPLLGMQTHPDEERLKGVSTPAVTLFPLVGTRAPTPHVVRALPAGGSLMPGELLLLRIRLQAPAWVYLLSQKQGESSEILWPLHATSPHEPGEFELAESGTTLAIDPEELGSGARVFLVASPQRIEARRLQLRDPLRTRAEVERAFPGCGVDLVPVVLEPRR